MEEGLTDRIKRLEEQLALTQQEKIKKFKLPTNIRFQKAKSLNKNYCIVLIIHNNRSISFKYVPVEEDTVSINGVFYDASAGYMLNYKKYPMLILKEWDMVPLSKDSDVKKMKPLDTKEEFELAEKRGTLTSAEKLILTKMKLEAIKPKMNFNWKMVIIGLIAVVVGYGLLSYMGYV